MNSYGIRSGWDVSLATNYSTFVDPDHDPDPGIFKRNFIIDGKGQFDIFCGISCLCGDPRFRVILVQINYGILFCLTY